MKTCIKQSLIFVSLFACTAIHAMEDPNKADNPIVKLITAAMNGNIEEIERLISQEDVDVNAIESRYGSTPLTAAASNGQIGCVRFLLAHGACPDKVDHCNQTVLMEAVNHQDCAKAIQCISIILSHKIFEQPAKVHKAYMRTLLTQKYPVKFDESVSRTAYGNALHVNAVREIKQLLNPNSINTIYGILHEAAKRKGKQSRKKNRWRKGKK